MATLCPLADNLVQFKVEGAGKIEAMDNGNAASVEPFQADKHTAFNGLALLIVRGRTPASPAASKLPPLPRASRPQPRR